MIKIVGYTKQKQWLTDLTIEDLNSPELDWYWVDFSNPKEEECRLLDTFFIFIRSLSRIATICFSGRK